MREYREIHPTKRKEFESIVKRAIPNYKVLAYEFKYLNDKWFDNFDSILRYSISKCYGNLISVIKRSFNEDALYVYDFVKVDVFVLKRKRSVFVIFPKYVSVTLRMVVLERLIALDKGLFELWSSSSKGYEFMCKVLNAKSLWSLSIKN